MPDSSHAAQPLWKGFTSRPKLCWQVSHPAMLQFHAKDCLQ